jgi:hypothetical protein
MAGAARGLLCRNSKNICRTVPLACSIVAAYGFVGRISFNHPFASKIMAERTWFIAVGDRQEGPIPDAQFMSRVAAGQITPDTLVWSDGMPEWQRAADTAGLMSGAPPLRSLAGGSPQFGGSPSGAFSADFGVWPILWRGVVLVLGALTVVLAPWAFTSFYRWAIAHIHVPGRPNLAFTGKAGDIWWVFVLIVLCSYASEAHVRYLPLLLVPIQAALSWMTIRWVVSNISSQGQQLPLRFVGGVWGYIGWTLFLDLSFITIIGWAWVETAWMRWIARNIDGATRAISFNAPGWQMLWRIIVLILVCILIIPIPWMVRWYSCWFISQFSVDEKIA